MFQLSNNHLLTADTSIRDKLKEAKGYKNWRPDTDQGG